MHTCSRRTFLAGVASVAACGGSQARAEGPIFDCIIKGGEVIDPSQGLRAKLDVGIRNGLIDFMAPNIPAEEAIRGYCIDATGKLVTPGLVDLHAHVWPAGNILGIAPDKLSVNQGTTTVVSAGDAGANNFTAFRRQVETSQVRVYAFVHLANMGFAGFPVPELLNIGYAQTDAAARVMAENADMILGVKVRMSEIVVAEHRLEPLRRAIAACEAASAVVGNRSFKVMCHIGGVETPKMMEQVLDHLRPGDIVTHCFTGLTNAKGAATNLVQDGKLLPAALAAKARGVVFDVAHGRASFDYAIAEAAIAQGLAPDTVSSDVNLFSPGPPEMPRFSYLTWVMSMFLGLGFSLEQVIAMATVNAARVIDRAPGHGTLAKGAQGDVTVLELEEAPIRFVDYQGNRRTGMASLRPVTTLVQGRVSV